MRFSDVLSGWSRLAIASKSASTAVYTRDLKHLEPLRKDIVAWAKTIKLDIKPVKDRVVWWNIVPGDFVRVRRPEWRGPEKGRTLPDWDVNKSGNNSVIQENDVLQVLSVNRLTNEVLLKGMNYLQRDLDALGQNGKTVGSIKVPYHDCQLFLGWYSLKDKPSEQVRVFARRLERTPKLPAWDPALKRFQWQRYATATIPAAHTLGADFPAERFQSKIMSIPWPEEPEKLIPDENPFYDTLEEEVQKITYVPPKLPYLDASEEAPQRADVDAYINALHNERVDGEDVAMESHLAVELSNPHSSRKKQIRWQEKQLYKQLLKKHIKSEETRNPMGRRKMEIEEDADYKWRAALAQEELFDRKRREYSVKRVAHIINKRIRKRRRAAINARKFNAIRLVVSRNQVIPPAPGSKEYLSNSSLSLNPKSTNGSDMSY